MTVLVQQAPIDHLPWLAERARINLHTGLFAIEVVRGDEILAMVAYEPHFPRAVMMHVALESPEALLHLLHKRPTAFQLAFDPPPHGLGAVEVFAPVLGDNERSIELVTRLGFRKFHDGIGWMGEGQDLHWYGLRREDCRFLGGE